MGFQKPEFPRQDNSFERGFFYKWTLDIGRWILDSQVLGFQAFEQI